MRRPSIYEFAGGAEGMLALAAATHERCLQDPELSHAFSHGFSPRHTENLAAYWAEVFGGPDSYSRSLGGHSGMLGIHAGQGAPEEWGDRFATCFIEALDDADLPDDPDFRSALRDYIYWATSEVNTYGAAGTTVKSGQPMPHWSWDGLQPT